MQLKVVAEEAVNVNNVHAVFHLEYCLKKAIFQMKNSMYIMINKDPARDGPERRTSGFWKKKR